MSAKIAECKDSDLSAFGYPENRSDIIQNMSDIF